MHLFVVTPHSFDPRFEQKIRLVSEMAQIANVQVGWANPTAVRRIAEEMVGFELLKKSDFVLGDLSFERPSCYFEIGLAQGLNKPVSLIAENGTPVHQVIGRTTVEFYSSMKEYKEIVENVLRRFVEDSSHRGNGRGDN
jgi:hypothetical protein